MSGAGAPPGAVAGLGFRRAATTASLRAALAAAGAGDDGARLVALATVAAKAQAPALTALAAALGLKVLAIPPAALAAQTTPTRSARVVALHGAGCVAEAAALAGAAALGHAARLRGPRAVSPDGVATAAVAEMTGPDGGAPNGPGQERATR